VIEVGEPIDADALRIRHEFLTRPGWRASVDLCARRLDASTSHARRILDSLVDEGFLERVSDDDYARLRRC
jgi:DNA-binding IclR family transcriptional regulator